MLLPFVIPKSKKMSKVKFMLALVLCMAADSCQDTDDEESRAQEYMAKLDKEAGARNNRIYLADWAYSNNVTGENNDNDVQVRLEGSQEEKRELAVTLTYNYTKYENATLKRMFQKYSKIGNTVLPEDKYERLLNIVSYMETNYASAAVCDYHNSSKCDLVLEPDLINIFATNQVPEELKYYWVEWHKVAGTKVKSNFTEYVELDHEAAKLNNYSSVAEWWQSDYEVTNFEEQMENIWQTIKPLYQQLHAYIRRCLREKYGKDVVSAKGPIPAHLLGDIWGSTWMYLEDFSRPYPDKSDTNVTSAMIAQNYTVLKIFKMADEFFQSLNLTAVPESFWNKSVIEKPLDRDVLCHASAWDFYDSEDFRILVCAEVNSDYFQIIHHELGHIQYYLQYRHQPIVFREGANPGFHEAVGDTIALSVTSPKHLQTVGLIEAGESDDQTEINQLYKMALDKVAFFPFALMLETYRYGVFRGNTTSDNYNCHYYRLKEQYQGMEPPVTRTEEDFDAGAKYHVSANVEYARYFVSYVVQFQFHRSLCQTAGQYDPNNSTKKLLDCDIYQSPAAGNAFANMLKMGSSQAWPDAMEAITGQRDMTGDGVLEYFKPLYDWLVAENNRTGEYIGWESSTIQYCTAEQLAALQA